MSLSLSLSLGVSDTNTLTVTRHETQTDTFCCLPNDRISPESMRISGRSGISAAATASHKPLNSATDSDLPSSDSRKKKWRTRSHRRRIKTSGFSATDVRMSGNGADGASAARRTETPLLEWKLDEEENGYAPSSSPPPPSSSSPPPSSFKDSDEKPRLPVRGRKVRRGPEAAVSARRLAAGLWWFRSPVAAAGGGGITRRSFGFQAEPSFQFPNSSMEGATKWDLVRMKTSHEAEGFLCRMKLLDQQASDVSLISVLESKLGQAHAQIQQLQTERMSSKKRFGHFMKKLNEEKAMWRSREHEKIHAVIDDVKAGINRERKNRRRMELVNSKLVSELANLKISAKQVRQDYEKERKSRELMEEICDELANEIRSDEAELEALKRDAIKLREEVEDERRMLQMAEVWREERVQMKLIDAKVALDEKYTHISKLVADMQDFMRSGNVIPDPKQVREAKLHLHAAPSENIEEFSYETPNPDDVFAVFEDFNLRDTNRKDLETRATQSPATRFSKIHSVRSPEVSLVHSSQKQNDDMDDDESGWETVSQPLEWSSYSPDGSSDLSVPKIHQNGNVPEGRMEWEENPDKETHISEMSKVCVIQSKQSKKSSIAKFWKSCPNNCESFLKISVPGTKGRLSNARITNGSIISPDHGSVQGRLSPSDLVVQWSSPDSSNPNTNRVTKGCIEWPCAMQKYSLKTTLFQAKIESQRIQLRHVLKQKS